MEFDFQQFCAGLVGQTEESASSEILRAISKLADERSRGKFSKSEELLCQEWDEQLRSLYRKTDLLSKRPFRIESVVRRG